MKESLKSAVLKYTGATSILDQQVLQNLWSGYGEILRIKLQDSPYKTIIAKYVQISKDLNHPRGWNTDVGHQRKIKSYQIESHWYQHYSRLSKARLPKFYAIESHGQEIIILMEDLNQSGFSIKKEMVKWLEISNCLKWLAEFHASFYQVPPNGLWKEGSYWHLDTRLEELQMIDDKNLKNAARAISNKLNTCKHKTIIHGDAKLANFCFSKTGSVAGVDFQYVGAGCGIQDVAYFVGSCLNESECERLEKKILDTYFEYLQDALEISNPSLEKEWRSLYHVAWADFYRFLKGWSPSHWKINSYSERITLEVINNL